MGEPERKVTIKRALKLLNHVPSKALTKEEKDESGYKRFKEMLTFF